MLVATYNSNNLIEVPSSNGSLTHCGWARSTDNGTTWSSVDDKGLALPGYGTGTNGDAYGWCLGDTWVSRVGPPNLVAMTAVAFNVGKLTKDVALWTSGDAALHWTKVARISTGTTGGDVDGPKVAADPNNSTLWVWWWNKYRHYLRPVTVSGSGVMTPGTIIDLSGKFTVFAPFHATIAIKPGAVGQKPTIFLTYPSQGMDPVPACDIVENQTTLDVTWYLAISTDGGLTWTERPIDHDKKWKRCLSATAVHGNQSYVASTFDGISGRLLLTYNRSVYDESDRYVGTRVVIKQWPDEPNGTGFDTWIPICNPNVCPDPQKTCFVNGKAPNGETYCNMWGGMIGRRTVGTSSRIAMAWYDTRDSEPLFPHPAVGDETTVKELRVDVWGGSIRPGEPYDGLPNNPWPQTASRLTPLGTQIPWREVGTNGNNWWGDYQQALIDGGSFFYAIWGDNRDGTTLTKLFGMKFNE